MLKAFYAGIQEQAHTAKVFAEIKDERVTYKDLLAAIAKTVTFLRSFNLSTNARIVMVTEEEQSLIILILTCLLEGLCPVVLAPDIRIDKLKQAVELSQAQLIFIDEVHIAECRKKINCTLIPIAAAKKPQAFINRVLGKSTNTMLSYPSLLHAFAETTPTCNAQPEDLALISFTSGSTATPKGVMLSYQNVFAHLDTFKTVFNYGSQSILFNNLPLHHMDGLFQGPLITLYCSASLIRPEKFSLQNLDILFNKIAAKKISHLILVPSILLLLDRYCVHDDYFATPFFQMIISTAAYLDPSLWARLQSRFKVKIYNVYGLIETVSGGLFCGPKPEHFAIGTIGVPIDMRAKIIAEDGTEQPQGVVGELLLQGENISCGYLGNPASHSPIIREGWLYTGDLAQKNAQGLFELVGRKKEVIISDGITIYPEEINEVLRLHPQVTDAACFAMLDEIFGEIIAVAVETQAPLTHRELIEFCQQHLEAEKTPKQILLMNELPRGPAGKPLLSTLKKIAQEQQNRSEPSASNLSAQEIINLAAEVFKVANTALSIHSKPFNILAWDSLGHIRLIEAAERQFQVRFALKDVMSIASLQDLYERTRRLLDHATSIT